MRRNGGPILRTPVRFYLTVESQRRQAVKAYSLLLVAAGRPPQRGAAIPTSTPSLPRSAAPILRTPARPRGPGLPLRANADWRSRLLLLVAAGRPPPRGAAIDPPTFPPDSGCLAGHRPRAQGQLERWRKATVPLYSDTIVYKVT